MLAAILLAMLVGSSHGYSAGDSCDASRRLLYPGQFVPTVYYECTYGTLQIKSCSYDYRYEVCPPTTSTTTTTTTTTPPPTTTSPSPTTTSPPPTTISPPPTTTSPPPTTTSPPPTTTSPPPTTTSPPPTTTSPPQTTTSPPSTTTSPPPTTTSPPATTTDSLSTTGEICYNKLFGCLPHPGHCDRYYQCNLGRAILKLCRVGFAFNPASRECVPITEENSCEYDLNLQQAPSPVDNKDNTIDSDSTSQQPTPCDGQYYNPYCMLFNAQSATELKPDVAINIFRNPARENQINIAIY